MVANKKRKKDKEKANKSMGGKIDSELLYVNFQIFQKWKKMTS